jgi:hypothetical protein
MRALSCACAQLQGQLRRRPARSSSAREAAGRSAAPAPPTATCPAGSCQRVRVVLLVSSMTRAGRASAAWPLASAPAGPSVSVDIDRRGGAGGHDHGRLDAKQHDLGLTDPAGRAQVLGPDPRAALQRDLRGPRPRVDPTSTAAAPSGQATSSASNGAAPRCVDPQPLRRRAAGRDRDREAHRDRVLARIVQDRLRSARPRRRPRAQLRARRSSARTAGRCSGPCRPSSTGPRRSSRARTPRRAAPPRCTCPRRCCSPPARPRDSGRVRLRLGRRAATGRARAAAGAGARRRRRGRLRRAEQRQREGAAQRGGDRTRRELHRHGPQGFEKADSGNTQRRGLAEDAAALHPGDGAAAVGGAVDAGLERRLAAAVAAAGQQGAVDDRPGRGAARAAELAAQRRQAAVNVTLSSSSPTWIHRSSLRQSSSSVIGMPSPGSSKPVARSRPCTASLVASISGSSAATGIWSTSSRYVVWSSDRPHVDRHEADITAPAPAQRAKHLDLAHAGAAPDRPQVDQLDRRRPAHDLAEGDRADHLVVAQNPSCSPSRPGTRLGGDTSAARRAGGGVAGRSGAAARTAAGFVPALASSGAEAQPSPPGPLDRGGASERLHAIPPISSPATIAPPHSTRRRCATLRRSPSSSSSGPATFTPRSRRGWG